jgi:hypothetical protein
MVLPHFVTCLNRLLLLVIGFILQACTAALNLAANNDANREKLGAAGACEAVAAVLKSAHGDFGKSVAEPVSNVTTIDSVLSSYDN